MTHTPMLRVPSPAASRRVRSLSIAVVTAAALTVSACGSGEASPAQSEAAQTQPADTGESVPTEESTSESGAGSGAGADSADSRGGDLEDARAAVTTAEEENAGTAHSLDFDENGQWEVTVISDDREWEYDISTDGSTIERRDEDTEDDADDQRELERAEVSLVEALEIALEDTPGTIDDIDLDEDDGELHWDVSIHIDGARDQQEIVIDAISGDVISSHTDEDDDDNDDD